MRPCISALCLRRERSKSGPTFPTLVLIAIAVLDRNGCLLGGLRLLQEKSGCLGRWLIGELQSTALQRIPLVQLVRLLLLSHGLSNIDREAVWPVFVTKGGRAT